MVNPTEASNPLWELACRLWEHDDVRAACLALQDAHGLNPNELLFAIWCARHGRSLNCQELKVGKLQQWHSEVTLPVRRARQHAVADSFQHAEAVQCLRQAELAAERVELQLFFDAFEQISRLSGQSTEQLMHSNLLSFRSIADGDLDQCGMILERLAVTCCSDDTG